MAGSMCLGCCSACRVSSLRQAQPSPCGSWLSFFPIHCSKSHRAITDWPSMGNMPIPELITGIRGLECSDWLGAIALPYRIKCEKEQQFPKKKWGPFLRGSEWGSLRQT